MPILPEPETIAAVAVGAQALLDSLGAMLGGDAAADPATLVRGWEAFLQQSFLLRVGADVALAVLLASTIAFHPHRHGRAVSLEEVEYPKTVLLYAVVGTMVAEIVLVSPAMALVVFGIGGLLRFRTDVGAAHDTGHVILATLVGIASGLGRYPLAIIATAVGWLLILALERGNFYRVVVEKVERRSIEASLAAYEELLRDEGWAIRGVKRDPGKERFFIYVRGSHEPEPEPLEDRLPSDRGLVPGEAYWEEI